MHAVILAGGKGTRLRPLTDTRPKPLLPFAGDPFAAGLLRRLVSAGCRTATFLVGQQATPFQPLRTLGEQLDIPVEIVTEPEPLGTAGAARDVLRNRDDGPFLVCNGDILTDLDYTELVRVHDERHAVATLALTRVEETSPFGVVDISGDGRVQRFIEKPPPGTVEADTINAGTYVLSPAAFKHSPDTGQLSFERVVFPGLVAAGEMVLGIPSDAFWMDLGTPQRYLAGQAAVLKGQCAWPLGESFVMTGGCLIHRTAAVAADASLDGSVVGPAARIGHGAVIRGSALFEHAVVGAGAAVRDSIVGEHAAVADGATLSGDIVARTHS